MIFLGGRGIGVSDDRRCRRRIVDVINVINVIDGDHNGVVIIIVVVVGVSFGSHDDGGGGDGDVVIVGATVVVMLIVGGGAVVDVVGVDVVDVGVVVFFGRCLDGLFFDVFEFSGDPKSAFAVVHHSTHRLDSTVTPNLDDLTLHGGEERVGRGGKG